MSLISVCEQMYNPLGVGFSLGCVCAYKSFLSRGTTFFSSRAFQHMNCMAEHAELKMSLQNPWFVL